MNYGKLYDDHVASTYDEDTLGLLTGARSLAIAQALASNLPSNATLLDLGVGTGETLFALKERFSKGKMIGIDLSAKMLAEAKRKLSLEAHVDDACNAAHHVPHGSVDLVLAHFITTFVPRPKLFRAAAVTLKPAGLFSVVSTTAQAFRGVCASVDHLLDQAGITAQISPAPESAETLTAELHSAGFTVLQTETFRREVVFPSFDETVKWGLQSGFFAHTIEALGEEQIGALAERTQGMFPFHDEYVGVAILATPSGSVVAS